MELKKEKLTQVKLKELLHYDPNTGDFTWKYRLHGLPVGVIAGTINSDGYGRIKINGFEYATAILANLYMEGFIPENQMDHKNRIRHDDRWDNLREASRQCQVRNRGLFKRNKSKIAGVLRHKKNNNWVARICVNYNQMHLGSFKNKIDAAMARWEAEKEYGFSNCLTDSSAYLYLSARGFCA